MQNVEWNGLRCLESTVCSDVVYLLLIRFSLFACLFDRPWCHTASPGFPHGFLRAQRGVAVSVRRLFRLNNFISCLCFEFFNPPSLPPSLHHHFILCEAFSNTECPHCSAVVAFCDALCPAESWSVLIHSLRYFGMTEVKTRTHASCGRGLSSILQVEGQEVMTSWQASVYRMMARSGMM